MARLQNRAVTLAITALSSFAVITVSAQGAELVSEEYCSTYASNEPVLTEKSRVIDRRGDPGVIVTFTDPIQFIENLKPGFFLSTTIGKAQKAGDDECLGLEKSISKEPFYVEGSLRCKATLVVNPKNPTRILGKNATDAGLYSYVSTTDTVFTHIFNLSWKILARPSEVIAQESLIQKLNACMIVTTDPDRLKAYFDRKMTISRASNDAAVRKDLASTGSSAVQDDATQPAKSDQAR